MKQREKHQGNRNTIYAIEEPETSQHPEWQVKLFHALMDLPKNERTQVIVTTHSPSLASLCPINNIIFLFKNNGKTNYQTGDNLDLPEVTTTLGILPNIPVETSTNLKVILCLEGPTDVEFFDNICNNFGI
nr:AAA family ATPase [Gilliamella sp. Pas-s27]